MHISLSGELSSSYQATVENKLNKLGFQGNTTSSLSLVLWTTSSFLDLECSQPSSRRCTRTSLRPPNPSRNHENDRSTCRGQMQGCRNRRGFDHGRSRGSSWYVFLFLLPPPTLADELKAILQVGQPKRTISTRFFSSPAVLVRSISSGRFLGALLIAHGFMNRYHASFERSLRRLSKSPFYSNESSQARLGSTSSQ